MSKPKGKANQANNFNTDKLPSEREQTDSKVLRVTKNRGASRRKVVVSKIKRRLLKHLWLVRIGLLAGILLAIYLFIAATGAIIRRTGADYYFGLAKDFVFTPKEKIESLEGRTNILILGKGGQGHEAPDLTDTIIFTSINHPTSPSLPAGKAGLRGASSTPSVTLISLPRDIWVPELRAKLNSVYYWGNQKQPPVRKASQWGSSLLGAEPGLEGGGGLILGKSEVERIVGAPVHYGVVVDFSDFKRIIDVLGGIEVNVERSFTDRRYPIPGREDDDCGGDDPEFLCRYETIQFGKGKQSMDGETALKFARSRNAEGDEGTDFARAARQEKVLAAIKAKALTKEILFNPKKVISVMKVIQESIETDIDPSASAILARRIFDARDNVYSKVLPENLLENPPKSYRYDFLYVFIPKDGVWDEVHKWVECVLKNGNCE